MHVLQLLYLLDISGQKGIIDSILAQWILFALPCLNHTLYRNGPAPSVDTTILKISLTSLMNIERHCWQVMPYLVAPRPTSSRDGGTQWYFGMKLEKKIFHNFFGFKHSNNYKMIYKRLERFLLRFRCSKTQDLILQMCRFFFNFEQFCILKSTTIHSFLEHCLRNLLLFKTRYISRNLSISCSVQIPCFDKPKFMHNTVYKMNGL